jgi:hypothetical protein
MDALIYKSAAADEVEEKQFLEKQLVYMLWIIIPLVMSPMK